MSNRFEILDALDVLTTQVWYNRHKNLEWRIELQGEHQLVTRAEWEANRQCIRGYGQSCTIDIVWEGALKSAKKTERSG